MARTGRRTKGLNLVVGHPDPFAGDHGKTQKGDLLLKPGTLLQLEMEVVLFQCLKDKADMFAMLLFAVREDDDIVKVSKVEVF